MGVVMRGVIERLVRIALEEDLGRGDVTTDATVPPGTTGSAALVAREPLVLAGLDVVEETFRQIDPTVVFERLAHDGQTLPAGAVAARLKGEAGSILRGERVALNFAQRMSGVATLAQRFVDAIPAGTRLRVTDTRKTTPGLRALERYAVRAGGAHNHREDLSAAVLIKDNHIAAAGGITTAVTRARERAPHTSRIECEVTSLPELREAIDAGADVVLLDNFTDDRIDEAMKIMPERILVEVSGGITLERIPRLARAGVHIVSVGALTHSARAVDLALDWET
jgi:nicotinate-nucleotide pyrophosphorylase (carboxylating)